VVDPDTREPSSDQTAGVGKYMLISPVHMPPTMNDAEVWFPQSALVITSRLDHENHRCSWKALIWPRMPFFYESERSQTLSVLDGKTLYESTEVFGGVLSYIIGFMFKRKLDEGFQAMAQGLKDRCEKTK
jgi:hypothetical protein